MSTAMFLKLHGIQGESRSPRHIGSIDISGFTWGNDPRLPPSSATGPGKVSIKDLTVFKPADRISPLLWIASHEGRNIRDGALTVEEFSNSGHLVRTLIWKLESILIDSITSSGHAPAGGQITEAVALNFANYKIMRF